MFRQILPSCNKKRHNSYILGNNYGVNNYQNISNISMDVSDRIISEEIMKGLKTKVIGNNVLVCGTTTSTMDIAKKLARKDFKNGTVIFAEEQTGGRGRSGHSWFCPRYKGLLFTIMLKYNIEHNHMCLLTGAAAVSITETIRETLQLPVVIKWPNDILIDGKKVGGILVETNIHAIDIFGYRKRGINKSHIPCHGIVARV